jgi:hypothetical protein
MKRAWIGNENSPARFGGTVSSLKNPFLGERMLKIHPATYKVSTSNQTNYTIVCEFGDVDPLAIAQANQLPVDSILYLGQQLNIPRALPQQYR